VTARKCPQSYRAELARFGVDSFIVEPGALPTEFLIGMLSPRAESEDYAQERATLESSLQGMIASLNGMHEMLSSNAGPT